MHAAIGVLAIFPEAPHYMVMRSSIPRPGPDLQKNERETRRIMPWPRLLDLKTVKKRATLGDVLVQQPHQP